MAYASSSNQQSVSAKKPKYDSADLECYTETNGVITTTMFDVPGYRVVRVLGTVYGMTVRTRNWAASIGMGLKSAVGGELKWFTNMMYSARNEAVSRLVDECQKRQGNAIIAMRFDAADLAGFAQVCAYGTAALVEKVDENAADAPQLLTRS
ncbi:hypothetical protein J7T55_006546 [Diaporthe amygdali]|uniref:uncharacterized protein n=1 Tax=Phomopsis amygdali TaxID=1214568 RepID=UPI0022FE10C3|nr:uncharacterized protein J7T55_006546 [Diaporthe amygdali]KAJ0125201.1 hypothetical protein J7T55_006546 [Diaporthe amygdali]